MTIFKRWFEKVFVPEVQCFMNQNGLLSKAVILLDNYPAHLLNLKSEDDQIKCYLFPPNMTSKLQLMDYGIINVIKSRYRKKINTKNCSCR